MKRQEKYYFENKYQKSYNELNKLIMNSCIMNKKGG